MRHKPFSLRTLALLVAAIPGSVSATTVFTGGNEFAINTAFAGGFVQGLDFTSNADQPLSALGFWDSGANGLTESYTVGLWQTSTQALLALVSIGNEDPLDTSLTVEGGQWRYETLGTTVNLTSGTTYTLGFYAANTFSEPDALFLRYSTVTIDSTISITDQRRFMSNIGLAFPTGITEGGDLFVGQLNARLGAEVIPEPSSALLFGMGVLGVVARRRRIG